MRLSTRRGHERQVGVRRRQRKNKTDTRVPGWPPVLGMKAGGRTREECCVSPDRVSKVLREGGWVRRAPRRIGAAAGRCEGLASSAALDAGLNARWPATLRRSGSWRSWERGPARSVQAETGVDQCVGACERVGDGGTRCRIGRCAWWGGGLNLCCCGRGQLPAGRQLQRGQQRRPSPHVAGPVKRLGRRLAACRADLPRAQRKPRKARPPRRAARAPAMSAAALRGRPRWCADHITSNHFWRFSLKSWTTTPPSAGVDTAASALL
jgi:hypothetical protein